jgi:hypothetical protein
MPYAADISRANPSCFLFLVDQSGSMEDGFGGSTGGRSKAQELADVLNRLLQTLVTRCAKGEEVHDYFDVGVIGYGQTVGAALQGPLGGRDFVRISEVAFSPALLESRVAKVPDGAGGLVEQSYYFPIWIDPSHNGGTPMCEALQRAKAALDAWLAAHPNAYPPTVLHITDGESTDGDPTAAAAAIRALATSDGPVLLFNAHLSSSSARPLTFPGVGGDLPDDFARVLFDMSSPLPERLRKEAASEGYPVSDDSRGFAFNADLVEVIRFIDIGTRVAALR